MNNDNSNLSLENEDIENQHQNKIFKYHCVYTNETTTIYSVAS